MNERKDQSDQIGQDGKASWDGSTGRFVSWGEIIAREMTDSGTDNRRMWYTQKGIKKLLRERGHEPQEKLNTSLLLLVRGGYVERAIAPETMAIKKVRPHKTFLYRRTLKPYKAKQEKMAAYRPGMVKPYHMAQRIFCENRNLPKWFRDMMFF